MQRTVVIIRSVRQIIRWPKRRLPTGTMFIGLMGRYSGRPRLFRDFVFRSTFSVAKNFNFTHQYYPSFLQEGNYYNNYTGKAVRGSNESVRTLWDNTLKYEGTFKEIHALDALFGVSFERYKAGDFSATGVDFPMDKILNNLSSATTPYDVSGNSSGNGLISVFGRFNYQLMEKYLFTFTARFDGSSKFGSHNKYGFFPSGAFCLENRSGTFHEGY